MRVLVVSNRYPPYYTGGYELNCREAVEGLRRLGHQVRVLTSAWGVKRPLVERTELNTNPLEIFRTLTPCFDFWLKRHNLFFSRLSLWHDRQAVEYVLKDFTPDLIYVWNMDWSSIAALSRLQATTIPMIYHFGAPWLNTYAERKAHLRSDPVSQLYRKIEGQEWGWDYRKLHIDQAVSMTAFIRQSLAASGWIKSDSPVIFQGFDLSTWPFNPSPKVSESEALRLLFVGRLDPLKGIDTIVEALPAILQIYPKARLTVSNTVNDNSQNSSIAYRKKLEAQAQLLEVNAALEFVQTPREDLPNLFSSHHILIFPSIWQEPFGLIPLEAMACGTPVIATGTGGSAEYLKDGENCLLFAPGDAKALVDAVVKLAEDISLRERFIKNGRHLVERDFQLDKTISSINELLENFARYTKV